MVNLLYTELLKLKRAHMLWVSIIGAAAAPVMMFIGFMNSRSAHPDEPVTFEVSFYNTNLYVLLLIGTLLYGVITSYLFHREYAEDTLKNLLIIPVSKLSLIVSKCLMLFLWIMLLTAVAWGLTFVLGLIGRFDGLTAAVILVSLKQFFLGGCLLFLLSTPTIFVTLLFKNYVPTIIFTAVITMANVALASHEYRVLFPWSAVHAIAVQGYIPEYPALYSYIAVSVASLAGFAATVIYFEKSDIH
ncbi:ABC transporter permease [Paenibacillus sp. NPDC056579]|uniref:ABC transporter permease n=1 Tax=Paenibacillus sp. NPDC056579 TaxID=3345871 RepID=UPI0036B0B516